MIIVDTSVWSRAFRRRADAAVDPVAALLTRLIADHERLVLPGIVYQELLSGVREEAQSARLRGALEPFEIVLASLEDHREAARISNLCRAGGVATSTPDALIAAMAVRRSAPLLTADRDHVRMAEISAFEVRFVLDQVG